MPPEPRALLLDLDGTLYVGGATIPGAPEAVAALRRAGVPFRFVTNTTSRPRAALAERLHGCGIPAGADEIHTPLVAAAALLRQRGARVVAPFFPPASLADLEGFELAGGVAEPPARATPQAVVVGDLGERWSYALLQEAFDYLLRGATLVALSQDRYFRSDAGLALDAGPFVTALEYASGRTAVVAGKPSAPFFHAAIASMGLGGGVAVAMIGDDLWSDVRGAQEAGYAGWLVRTGKFRADALRDSGIVPDRVLDSVAEVATLAGVGA